MSTLIAWARTISDDSIMHRHALIYAGKWVLLFCSIICVVQVRAASWPDNYVVHENSESPDHRYGILVPALDAGVDSPDLGETNYLVNLETHQLLGKIRGADYFEGQTRHSLNVSWAADSTWCVADYEQRWNFGSIAVLEPRGLSFDQTEIGQYVGKRLEQVIRHDWRQSDYKSGWLGESVYFRLEPDRKLHVISLATTNPKQFEDTKTYCALFHGTFDVLSKKWSGTDTRRLDSDEYEAVLTACQAATDVGFPNEQSRADWLERRLNDIYRAVRLLVPSGRFATIKQEQIAWLKKREAATALEDKSKLTEERTQQLQGLIW